MAWKIEFDKKVKKDFEKLDIVIRKRIFSKLKEISMLDNPKSTGKALTGNLSGLWRYRVGDYRIICFLDNRKLIVLVVGVGHRNSIYDD